MHLSLQTQKLINQIKMLVGVTQDDFQKLYVDSIERFLEFINTNNIDETLENVVLALKRRRGYLLPIGADSEACFREREEWTFAVFTGCLLTEVDLERRLDATKIILSIENYDWLYRNKTLFSLWQDYLLGSDEHNIFNQIIQPHQQTHEPIAITPEKPKEPPPHTSFKAPDFWNWLQTGITRKTIHVNDVGDFVHIVDIGILIVIPQCIDAFIGERTLSLELRIALTKAIKKHDALIRNSQGSRIHSYCFGNWQDRKVIAGIVINRDTLVSREMNLAINTNLAPDPIENV